MLPIIPPILLWLGATILLFTATLFILDKRRAGHENHLRRLMRAFVASNATKSFTIVTNVLNGDDISPLIERLANQNYDKLQLLLFTDAEYSKAERRNLIRIQRQMRGTLPISIIKCKDRDNERKLVKRYAHGEALLWLAGDERLTPDFFTRMSFELLDESATAISPRFALATDDTLRRASSALNLVADQTARTLLGLRSLEARIIRKSAYTTETVTKSVAVEHSTVTTSPTSFEHSASSYYALGAIISVILISIGSALVLPTGWQLVTATFALALYLLVSLRLITYPYGIVSKVTLLLLIPLWPLVVVLLTASDAICKLVAVVWLQRLRLNRKSNQ